MRDGCVRVCVPPEIGVNSIEIYLFTGINHRELYDGAYITQIGDVISIDKKFVSLFPLSRYIRLLPLVISSRDISYFFPLPFRAVSSTTGRISLLSMFSHFLFPQSGCCEDLIEKLCYLSEVTLYFAYLSRLSRCGNANPL